MYLFDLHCDTLTEARLRGLGLRSDSMQLSIDRLPGAGWVQCYAIFLPDTLRGRAAVDFFETHVTFFGAQMRTYATEILPVRTLADCTHAQTCGKRAAMLTVEGGAVLGGRLSQIERLRQCGVRMLTLTWNGANELAGGVGASALEQQFTPFGRAAVAALEQAEIFVDVSHLSDPAFWELCTFATRPFVASHSNLRALCNHPRNLTDAQFGELVRRGGLVGLNFCAKFLEESGRPTPTHLLGQLERMLALGGERVVALGSDFDGADLPDWLGDVRQLPWLREQITTRFGAQIAERVFWRNAQEFFARGEQGVPPDGRGFS